MSNTVLTPTVVAAEAIRILENNLVMGNLVHRGYEEEFDKKVNGYDVGSSITIRKPTDFTVRDGAVAAIQDATEGSTTFTVDKQKGVDFKFTSTDLTLSISNLSDRIIKPALIQLANQIDGDLLNLYKNVWNCVGTPAATAPLIDTFADFAKAPERLDLQAVPQSDRYAVLSPSDTWAMLGSQTALYMQDAAKDAYREGRLGRIANVETYASQNVKTHTVGTRDNTTPLVKGASQSTTWASSRTYGHDVAVDGRPRHRCHHQAGRRVHHFRRVRRKSGDQGNPRLSSAVRRNCGRDRRRYHDQHDHADHLAPDHHDRVRSRRSAPCRRTMRRLPSSPRPLPMPSRRTWCSTRTHLAWSWSRWSRLRALSMSLARATTAISVRVIPYYDGTNDVSNWRLDVLYGVKTLDARLACRIIGT
jgi:hypothetical protein